jgi:hypothetical protein
MGNIPIVWQAKAVMGFDDAVWHENRQYRRDLPPGAAHWIGSLTNDHAVLDFTCPCGCGVVHAVSVCRGTKTERSWLWDGDIENPTLTPSIQCLSPCGWHGYLTAGEFKQV